MQWCNKVLNELKESHNVVIGRINLDPIRLTVWIMNSGAAVLINPLPLFNWPIRKNVTARPKINPARRCSPVSPLVLIRALVSLSPPSSIAHRCLVCFHWQKSPWSSSTTRMAATPCRWVATSAAVNMPSCQRSVGIPCCNLQCDHLMSLLYFRISKDCTLLVGLNLIVNSFVFARWKQKTLKIEDKMRHSTEW